MFRFLAIFLLALHAVSADEELTVSEDEATNRQFMEMKMPMGEDGEERPFGLMQEKYDFHKNLGAGHCKDARKKYDDEDVRLWCINDREGFWGCSQMCTEMLFFEPSTGKCRSDRCNFYNLSVPYNEDGMSNSLKMSEIAEDKVTVFVFAPQVQGVGEYSYEMMEHILESYKDEVEVLYLPVDPFEHEEKEGVYRWKLEPHEDDTKKVRILPMVKVNTLLSYPFLNFIRTLLHTEGFRSFDVYIDRPVVFVINKKGTQVRRLVVPHIDTLLETINAFQGEGNASVA